MKPLTDAQKKAMLQLGDPTSEHEILQEEVVRELIALGLVYESGENAIDFTDEGERVYDQLAARPD
jgi:hypothetical protein